MVIRKIILMILFVQFVFVSGSFAAKKCVEVLSSEILTEVKKAAAESLSEFLNKSVEAEELEVLRPEEVGINSFIASDALTVDLGGMSALEARPYYLIFPEHIIDIEMGFSHYNWAIEWRPWDKNYRLGVVRKVSKELLEFSDLEIVISFDENYATLKHMQKVRQAIEASDSELEVASFYNGKQSKNILVKIKKAEDFQVLVSLFLQNNMALIKSAEIQSINFDLELDLR